MQGLWKENLRGWNHKDSKRKKQTRRHSFKDKAKGIATRHGSSFKWTFDLNRTKKHHYSCYTLNSDETFYLVGIYGINFKSHRDWVIVYPEAQGLRKNAQKLANRTTRAKLKQWLSKKDYDMEIEIETHGLEKSIELEIQ